MINTDNEKLLQEFECSSLENMDIGHLVKILGDRFKAWGDRSMKEQNLTIAQVHILTFIHSRGESASQKEIENYLKVSHPTVVGIINRMEKNGYVTTHQDETDRRNKIVCATKKADAARDATMSNKSMLEEKICKGLSSSEVAELKRLLAVVYENLEDPKNQLKTH